MFASVRSRHNAIALLGVLAAAASTVPALAQSPEISINQGVLIGNQDGNVSSFLGIPYAAPPINQLRWKPPAQAPSWSKPRDAKAFGPSCPQPVRNDMQNARQTAAQNEDCLSLNVWTSDPNGRAPVMVWIHGGGHRVGSGSVGFYNGTELARQGVVLVTINYRLGLLGYFAHPALTAEAGPAAPLGNYGMMDQIAALKWVRENISKFGGDPGNVTVFGESAGGASILYLLATPSAKGSCPTAWCNSVAMM